MTEIATGQFRLVLTLDTDEGLLPLEFFALTSDNLRTLLVSVEKGRFGPSHHSNWEVDTDQISIVAHVNGATAEELHAVLTDTYEGFKVAESATDIGWPLSFDENARRLAKRIVRRVRRQAPAIVEAGGQDPIHIEPEPDQPLATTGKQYHQQFAAYSVVDGVLDLISVRGNPYFVIHEHGTNVAVRCRFPGDEWLQRAKELLGKRVIAEGFVRYRPNGTPISLINPISLDRVPEPEYNIAALRGVLPGITGGLSAYDYVRRLREDEEP